MVWVENILVQKFEDIFRGNKDSQICVCQSQAKPTPKQGKLYEMNYECMESQLTQQSRITTKSIWNTLEL